MIIGIFETQPAEDDLLTIGSPGETTATAGAVLVNYAKTYLTGAFPEIWLYFLGALFVLVTLFLPRGIIGLLSAHGDGDK